MPRSSDSNLRAAALLCWTLAAGAGCGGGLEISLQLKPGLDGSGDPYDTASLRTLRVTLESAAGRERSPAFAIDREQQVAVPPLEVVDNSKDLTVDVWGCERPDACNIEDVTLRGCTPEPLPFAGRSGTEVVVIALVPVLDGRNADCPSP